MKHRFMACLAAVALLLGGAGCISQRNMAAGDEPVVLSKRGMMPMQWVEQLAANPERIPEVTTRDAVPPFNMTIPQGFAAIGSGLRNMVCAAPDKSWVMLLSRPNLCGADNEFWRQIITGKLVEKNGWKVDNAVESLQKTTENIDCWSVEATKTVANVEYRLRMVVAVFQEKVNIVMLCATAEDFMKHVEAFDAAVDTMDLALWRAVHQRSSTDPFLCYDPIAVYPRSDNGLRHEPWTPLLFGLAPAFQSVGSESTVYGVGMNLFFLEQEEVNGVSLSLLNAVRISRGIQLGVLSSVTEANNGLAASLLYTGTAVNNGVSVGLITRSEEDSTGVQIGLLNFSSDPAYFPCFPIINFPFFRLFQ